MPAAKPTPAPPYITVGTLKRGGRWIPPGTTITVADDAERDRLLKLGAIIPVPEFMRRPARQVDTRGIPSAKE